MRPKKGAGSPFGPFEIKEILSLENGWTIRQHRYDATDGRLSLSIDNMTCPILNYSTSGVLILSQSPLESVETLRNIPFLWNGKELTRFNLRRVRHDEKKSADGYGIALELTDGNIEISWINGIQQAGGEILRHEEENSRFELIPAPVRQRLFSLKFFLERLRESAHALETRVKIHSLDEARFFEDGVATVFSSCLKTRFDEEIHGLSGEIRDWPEPQRGMVHRLFDQHIGPFIEMSPFSERCRRQPLGYPCDFETINLIHQGGSTGRDLFSRVLDRHIVRLPCIGSVRKRSSRYLELIRDTVESLPRESRVKILAICPGPAVEMQQLLTEIDPRGSEKLDIHFLDQDLHALNHIKSRLSQICISGRHRCEIRYFQKTIKNLAHFGPPEQDYQLIYCGYILDYFTDAGLKLMVDRLVPHLAPGGKLAFSRFNGGHPSLFFLDLAFGWEIVERSPDELEKLLRTAGTGFSAQPDKDNIDLLCEISR